jgi:membrane protein DedA with SNARE-associated domain
VLHAVAAALSSGPQPVLPGFLNSLASPLAHFGLWAVLALVLVEDFGIPVPGETVLIAAAIYAGSGRLNVVAVGLVGFAAAVVGDNIGYAIGRFGGRALIDRYGKYIFLTPERLDKTEVFFERHGTKIIIVARFIEGLRQANGIIAGITGMHWLKFVLANALGAALWVGTWVSIGYFAGQHITTIYNDVTRYSLYVAIAAVLLIAVWVLQRVRKRRAKAAGPAAAAAKTTPAESTPAESTPAESTPAETASTETPSTGAAPATAQPAEPRPAQTAEADPAGAAGAEALPAQASPAGTAPAATGNGQHPANGQQAGPADPAEATSAEATDKA